MVEPVADFAEQLLGVLRPAGGEFDHRAVELDDVLLAAVFALSLLEQRPRGVQIAHEEAVPRGTQSVRVRGAASHNREAERETASDHRRRLGLRDTRG